MWKVRKNLVVLVGIFLFSLFPVMSTTNTVHAATFENGTYSISFELKESGTNNASIADGYFSKPARLVVKDGVNYIQLTTTESDWIKSISGPNGGATVISEQGNTRTVQMQVGDLSSPVNLKMHVVVPKEVAGMEYDHHHSVRADFNVAGIPTASTSPEIVQTGEGNEVNASITNPKTGDTSSIGLYMSLLLVSIGLFAFYRTRVAKN